MRDPEFEPAWVKTIRQYGDRPSHNHYAIWYMTHRLMERPAVRDFFRREFADLLANQAQFDSMMTAQDPELQESLYEFPDHVLYILIRENPEFMDEINHYLNVEVPTLERVEALVTRDHEALIEILSSRLGIGNFGREVLRDHELEHLETSGLRRAVVNLSSGLRLRGDYSKLRGLLDRLIVEDEGAVELRGRRRLGELSLSRLNRVMEDLRGRDEELNRISKSIGNVFRTMIYDNLGYSPDDMNREWGFFNPRLPLYVTTKSGRPSIRKIETVTNHPVLFKGETLEEGNLMQAMVDVINQAEKGDVLVFSFFQLDLREIADSIVQAHRRGVKVLGALDKKAMELALSESSQRHNVRAIKDQFDTLMAREKPGLAPEEKSFFVRYVDPVRLMHHKLIQVIKRSKKTAITLTSSGNPTRSGIHPLGDGPTNGVNSRPNADHAVIFYEEGEAQPDGGVAFPMADTLFYEVGMKLIWGGYRGRGRARFGQLTFPPGGSYFFEVDNGNYVTMTASPNGSLGNIGRHFFGRILEYDGPVDIAQFAFSSRTISDGLLRKLKRDLDSALEKVARGELKPENFRLQFNAIGERPFSMFFWSEFLKMVGLSRPSHIEVAESGVPNVYSKIPSGENSWKNLLTDPKYSAFKDGRLWDYFRNRIYTAPRSLFGTFNPGEVVEEDVELGVDGPHSVKQHHKILRVGDATTLGSHFNMSDGAENNNEIAWGIVHRDVAEYSGGIVRWLISQTARGETVVEEALRRNRWSRHQSEFFLPSVPPLDFVVTPEMTPRPMCRDLFLN